MKKIIIMCLLLSCLTGCIAKQRTPRYVFNEAEIVYKEDPNSMIGDVGAVYEDRIYYFSQESGASGIYSMNLDGSQVQLEVPSRDVQKMQIVDDTLYYLDLKNVYYNVPGSTERWGNKFYDLKTLHLKSGEVTELTSLEKSLSDAVYIKVNEDDRYRGIWDFYYVGDDTFVVMTLETSVPTGRFRLRGQLMKNDQPVIWQEGNFEIFDQWERLEGEHFHRYQFEQLHFLSGSISLMENHQFETDALCLYDEKQGISSYTEDPILVTYDLPLIYPLSDKKIYIGIENFIYQYDLETNQCLGHLTLENADDIRIFGKKLLAGFEDGERIYDLNEDKLQVKELVHIPEGRVIDIDEDCFIQLERKNLSKKRLFDQQVIWETPLPANILSEEHKIERSGDWLFVKAFDVEAEQSVLLEKINLKNGERLIDFGTRFEKKEASGNSEKVKYVILLLVMLFAIFKYERKPVKEDSE